MTDDITRAEATDQSESRNGDDLFESVGRKVENLAIGNNGQSQGTDNGPDDTLADQTLVDEIESLCMHCRENGTTRLLLTRIPFFHEIILMSFFCPHCNFKNSEIQSAGQIQQRGCRYSIVLSDKEGFARQVVKSDTCVAKFEELDIEIPPGRGQLTNVEGLLSMVIEDLDFEQPTRKALNPELFGKIDEIIQRGRAMLVGDSFPVTLSVDDPAGNSWIEPSTDRKRGEWSRSEYDRSSQQNEALALTDTGNEHDNSVPTEPSARVVPQLQDDVGDGLEDAEIVPDEVYTFPSTCPGCTRECDTHMKMVQIPHFKEVVIMSTVCQHCGYRSNEVKTGGKVPAKGSRITLQVDTPEDLARDILKSESCAFSCPELNLDVTPGTLGGRFTTVEGLLTQVRDDLHSHIFDTDGGQVSSGDSLETNDKHKWTTFFEEMKRAIEGQRPFTAILEDPLASSYVQSLCAPNPDPKITQEDYERTDEEEEHLGLKDINVEGYEGQPNAESLKEI
ncbi:MAG: nucleolar zinc-finger protein [Piccolia ochrophora]|nr:MAG: nucleolar zinc-finger protein [Piccolia ochrophora]